MRDDDERAELARLVALIRAAHRTDAEQGAALRELQTRVPHPRVSDLIFWPASAGFDRELTPDEVVEVALAYRPFEF